MLFQREVPVSFFSPVSKRLIANIQLYGGVFPIYTFFYMGKVVSHLPLFSYMGAVSFLNKKNFNILDICVFNYYELAAKPPTAK